MLSAPGTFAAVSFAAFFFARAAFSPALSSSWAASSPASFVAAASFCAFLFARAEGLHVLIGGKKCKVDGRALKEKEEEVKDKKLKKDTLAKEEGTLALVVSSKEEQESKKSKVDPFAS